MGILSSVLPGLRDLRAPLASGFLWLAIGWLIWGADLPASTHAATGFTKDLYQLGDQLGTIGTASILGFVAYTVGIVIAPVQRFFAEVLLAIAEQARRILQRARMHIHMAPFPLERGLQPTQYDRAEEIVVTRFVERYFQDKTFGAQVDENWTAMEREAYRVPKTAHLSPHHVQDPAHCRSLIFGTVKVPSYAQSLLADLRNVPSRIVERLTKTFELYDQQRAEADFRLAIGVPLFVMPLALASRIDIPIAFVIALMIPGLLILLDGGRRSRAATDQLLSIVREYPESAPELMTRIGGGFVEWNDAVRALKTANDDD